MCGPVSEEAVRTRIDAGGVAGIGSGAQVGSPCA